MNSLTTTNTPSRRPFFGQIAKTIGVLTLATSAALPAIAQTAANTENTLTRKVYEAFQRGQLDRWDGLFAEDVVTNSSARFGTKGRTALKAWANEFLTAFAPRVDLLDEINAVDAAGNGRAVMTFNLNWKHVKPFFGLQPSGRTGTSIENLIMTVRNGKVVRLEVADTTLDLVIYLHERGWTFPQNIRPTPIVKGIERPVDEPEISLK
jgi:ketosteroid isomerase-like protein